MVFSLLVLSEQAVSPRRSSNSWCNLLISFLVRSHCSPHPIWIILNGMSLLNIQ